MTVAVASVANYATDTPPQAVETVTANLTPSSPGCVTAASGTNCMIALHLAPGSYWANVQTFGSLNGGGPVLSVQHWVALTVPAGTSNGSPPVIPWVLYGVPHTITIVPVVAANGSVRVTATGQATAYSNNSVPYTLAAIDATGAQIVGSGAPVWTITSSNGGFSVAGATAQSPNTITVTPPGTTAPATTQLTLNANFPDDASMPNGTNSSGVCHQVGAVCSATATLNRVDVSDDDWVTYGHDYQRTANETLATGLTPSSAANLTLRWKATVPNGVTTSSPVVFDGNVVVAALNVIYDYSTIDGTLLWSRTLASAAAKTPTIDGAAGLVFVGTRNQNNAGPLPSPYYALRLMDGSIAWQTTLDDMTKGGEVVANGTIYVPTAGGDPPACTNGGVQALSEATGTIKWTWYVNAAHNPGGGGAVWGSIGFDGSRLIFGTGNACQTPVTTANGGAALDLNGNLLWSFVAEQNSTWDYDTGGSALIRNAGTSSEVAVLLNKNGIAYVIDPRSSNGAIIGSATVNPNFGYGFWASPSSDGHVTIVGTGEYSNTAQSMQRSTSGDAFCPMPGTSHTRRPSRTVPGYHSTIAAFSDAGTQLWSYRTTEIPADYAAIAGGVTVFEADSTIRALNSETGVSLWSYPTAGTVDAGPVIVPSGVYAVDQSGNIYAFIVPYSSTSSTSTRRGESL